MANLLRSQSHIVVVDARPADYRNLPRLAGEHGWHVHFLTNARAAVRFARSGGVDLWIFGIRLPDMSGFELFGMLREHVLGTPVLIVADQYDPEEERRACSLGATLYLCKSASGMIHDDALLDVLVGQPHATPTTNRGTGRSRHTSSFP